MKAAFRRLREPGGLTIRYSAPKTARQRRNGTCWVPATQLVLETGDETTLWVLVDGLTVTPELAHNTK
jgi:predicted neutral ceramidase superfamily lipid hydrolase